MHARRCGADPNLANSDGAPPGHAAANNWHANVLTALVADLGADVNRADLQGNTPCHAAAAHLPTIKVLANLGADLFAKNKDGLTPSAVAEAKGKLSKADQAEVERAEAHQIARYTERMHARDHHEKGQRDDRRDDKCRAPVADHDQQYDGDQQRSLAKVAARSVQRASKGTMWR